MTTDIKQPTTKERLENTMKRFQDHKLKVILETDDVKIYEFSKPNSWNLKQRWVISEHCLIITGDCYDAIYCSGAFTSLESIASCNVSYFSSKCVADANGRNQSKFNADSATEEIHNLIISNFEHKELWEEELKDNAKKIELIEEYLQEKTDDTWFSIPRYFEDEYDTVLWIRQNTDLVGEDWWDGFSMNKKTTTPFFHLAAIKVAVNKM